MKKGTLLFLLAFLCFSTFVSAQPPCGFDIVHRKMLAENPAYANTVRQNEISLRNYIIAHPNLGAKTTSRTSVALFNIPVVVHVVHTGGAIGSIYNPTDAQIIGAIDYLNSVYDGTMAGTEGIGDMQIHFALAQRDPNCNPTNGIDRVNGSGIANYVAAGVNASTSGGTNEINVKNLSRWNTANYYNIWVVNKIDGADGTAGQFIAGFAYYPGAGAALDGTIMLATQMRANQKTLPHEIGHALNLAHPFEGSPDAVTCQPNADCNFDGDEVCDTDPISYNYNQTTGVVNFTCRTGANTVCGGTYSINTEHNYMNYTSCFTLFTAGQKARALAAMSLSDRASLATSLGATPTYIGGTQCTPKINFELSADGMTENTVTTTGCRSYRDYTFNMTIGNNPSLAATATLAIMGGGTATEGVDYDITTNGNFTSPSKIVSFPTGSHANQPFTIRIYDDAIVDGTENFTLNFTVNNGGGNAALGNGKPTLAITITDNDVAPIVPGTTGTGNLGTAIYSLNPPTFDARIQAQRTHMLYKASELTAAGVVAGSLTGVSFNLIKTSTRAFTNLSIKVGTTSATYLLDGMVTIASMTTVKTLASYNTVNGWNNFTFDTPFTWNGTSNVVIEVCFDNGSAAAGDGIDNMIGYSDGGTASQANMIYQSDINCGQSFSSVGGFTQGIKPITRITYGNPGNPVATTTVTSLSQHLGPNADVYFYSPSGESMARITNLTSFDYGCTQVSIDRTGSTSAQFWNSATANYLASKSFRVIPTNNTGAGHYQISLFYTQAEVTGWQTATTQSISGAKVVKVSNGFYIPDVTPSTPHIADISTVNASNTAFGTDYVITGDFNNTGFSGFSVGIPGSSVLPVTLVSFEGHKESNTVRLDWKTATELNNDHFEIETSKDVSNYYKIGDMESRGNSTSDQFYAFTDNLPAKGVNYYRLKQVDKDGKTTYSRVIAVTFDGKINVIQAYPNPVKDRMIVEVATPSSHVSLKIFTLEGKMVKQEEHGFIQRSQSVNVSKLSSGAYILQVQTGGDMYTLKFVKQ